jgi:hypothetical protein
MKNNQYDHSDPFHDNDSVEKKINLHIIKSIEQGLGGNMLIGCTTCPLKGLFKKQRLS